VAVITQSGAMCGSINRAINELGLSVSYLISCGNQIGCTIGDFIDYFADQPALRVILCYIEGVPDSPRFLEAARRARENGKHVVAVKIGSSEEARKSAMAHTGSLAGRTEIFDAFAAAAGIIRVDSVEDGIEAVEFLARKNLPRGRNVAVMTNSGALRNLTIEAADRAGVRLAKVSAETRAALRDILKQPNIDSPLDTIRTIPSDQYLACLNVLVDAPENDIVLVAEDLPSEQGVERRIANLRALAEAAQRTEGKDKSIVMFNPLLGGMSDYGRRVRAQMPHVPVMREIEKTMRVIALLTEAGTRKLHRGPFVARPSDNEVARSWRARLAALPGRTALNEVESKALLRAYGIPTAPERIVQNAADAERFAGETGFPVVLKAVSAAVPHKSDAGLVVLDVNDAAGVREAVALLTDRCKALGAPLEGILVAKQIRNGIETVLGVSRDPEMGPALMFGLGGVWVELFKDVSFAPANLDRDQALAMVKATRAGRLLEGFRGGKKRDCDALGQALVNLGRLAQDLGDVIEAVDINPFIVCDQGQGGFAVDGLVVTRP
jgi:acyl-CoA synthetase (NDP forming)